MDPSWLLYHGRFGLIGGCRGDEPDPESEYFKILEAGQYAIQKPLPAKPVYTGPAGPVVEVALLPLKQIIA